MNVDRFEGAKMASLCPMATSVGPCNRGWHGVEGTGTIVCGHFISSFPIYGFETR